MFIKTKSPSVMCGMKKIFAITLLSGFILFNLISIVSAQNSTASKLKYPVLGATTENACITNYQLYTVSVPVETAITVPLMISPGLTINLPISSIPFLGTAKKGVLVQVCLHKEDVATLIKSTTPSKQEIKGYTFYVKIPCQPIAGGTCPSNYSANPANYIARVYQFGLMIAGLAAFGMIVFGALQYVLSAGNMGSQEDAKDRITQAVFGLVLLFGAYLILYTINPNLVSLTNPNMPALDLSSITGVEDGGIGGGLGGAKEEHPLCQTGTYTGITVTSGINIGGRTPSLPSFICEKCKAYAERDGIGECKCIPGYSLSSSGNTCISGISKGDEACTSKGGDCVIKGSSAALDYCPSQKYEVGLCAGATNRQCCLP